MSAKFKPTLWLSIFTSLILAVLLSLGTWQVQRLAWKNDIISQVEKHISDRPVSIRSIFKGQGGEHLQSYNYKPVYLTGYYLHKHEIILRPRVYKKEMGAYILTPFKTEEGDIVFVNRGWALELELKKVARPQEKITINGLIHTPPRKNRFIPDNDEIGNIWYWADIKSLEIKTGLKSTYPIFLYQDLDENQKVLIGGQLQTKIKNDHLQYAITWYILALSLVIIYLLYCFRVDKK